MAKDVDIDSERSSKRAKGKRDARPSRVAPDTPPTDYADIALRHLDTTAAAADLRGLAKHLARMDVSERVGGKGSTAKRILDGASKAAAQAVQALRKVDLLASIDALGRPALSEAEPDGIQAAIAVEHRLHRLRWLDATAVALDRLAEGLAVSAQAVPRLERARPRRSRVFDIALEALEGTWWQYRTEVPTQSTSKGQFMAFALDVLTNEPCSFAKGSVSKAVRAYLKDKDRPALKATGEATPARPASRSVLVIGADNPVLRALVRLHAEADDRVIATAPADRIAAVQAELGGGITVAPLSLTRMPREEELAQLGEGPLDLLVIGGLTGRYGVIDPPGPEDFEQVDSAGWAQTALNVPRVLQAIMQGLRERLVLREGGKIVVITSRLASASHGRLLGGYTAAPAYAAINMLVSLWARDLGRVGLTVVEMHAGWGRREDGTSNRHTLPASTARVMRETIERLGAREQGQLVDLHGSLEPR